MLGIYTSITEPHPQLMQSSLHGVLLLLVLPSPTLPPSRQCHLFLVSSSRTSSCFRLPGLSQAHCSVWMAHRPKPEPCQCLQTCLLTPLASRESLLHRFFSPVENTSPALSPVWIDLDCAITAGFSPHFPSAHFFLWRGVSLQHELEPVLESASSPSPPGQPASQASLLAPLPATSSTCGV